jgi:hypothetical protein
MQPFRPCRAACGDTFCWRDGMTTFDDREKGFEKKFALDQDLKFRAESRRNKLLAEWAAAKLGIMGDALPDYIRSVVKADLEEKGDEDVFRKLHNDFAAADVKVSDTEIRAAMGDLLAKAVADIEASR